MTINKQIFIFLSIILTSNHFLCVLPTKRPLKSRGTSQERPVEDNDDLPTILRPIVKELVNEELKIKLESKKIVYPYLNIPEHPKPIYFFQEEEHAINLLRATLQLDKEVASRNIKNIATPTLIQAIARDAQAYSIESQAETLGWQSIVTGELFSLIWHRWQYKMRNTIFIKFENNLPEEYEITIITESSSDTIDQEKYPAHCTITQLLRKTKNFNMCNNRLQTIMTGGCHSYGCEKTIRIHCTKKLLLYLIAEQRYLDFEKRNLDNKKSH